MTRISTGSRRRFIRTAGVTAAGAVLASCNLPGAVKTAPELPIEPSVLPLTVT
jgi:predicted acylesterase/phospholipase RssA